jgi:hypothetical protein
MLFEDRDDPDHHIAFLRRSLSRGTFNQFVLGLRPGEPLDLLLRDRVADLVVRLQPLAPALP